MTKAEFLAGCYFVHRDRKPNSGYFKYMEDDSGLPSYILFYNYPLSPACHCIVDTLTDTHVEVYTTILGQSVRVSVPFSELRRI